MPNAEDLHACLQVAGLPLRSHGPVGGVGSAPTVVADVIRRSLQAGDAELVWRSNCGPLPRDANLLIDGVTLGLDVPVDRRGTFAILAQRDAHRARHRAYWWSRRASPRRGLGHLVRVSSSPRFEVEDRAAPPYAVISFAPPLLFDPAWQDFVTADLANRARAWLVELLSLATTIRVRQIDIAADLEVPIWSLQALAKTSRRFRVYGDDDLARTIESGSRNTAFSVAAYDKRLQLRTKRRIEIGHELTRIEVRLKVDLPLADLATLANPFDRVSVHRMEPQRDAPAGLKIAVRAARLLGLPRLRAVLDERAYDELLAATEVEASSWRGHPRRVFARQWRRVVRRLLRELGLSG